MRVKARVDDAAVCLAGTLGHVPGLFQHRNATVIAAQHTRQGTTHDTGTHDDDVAYQTYSLPQNRTHAILVLYLILYHAAGRNEREISLFLSMYPIFPPNMTMNFRLRPGKEKNRRKKLPRPCQTPRNVL